MTIFPLIGILIGLGISGFLIWDGLNSVVHHKYCPVLDDDFAGGLNTNIWTKEVEVGGFGYVSPHNSRQLVEFLLILSKQRRVLSDYWQR